MIEASQHPALRLVENQRTLVLATADPTPWSAPLYYLYAHRKFYFFSSPHSRHIQAAMAQGRCAASVYRESHDWREIEGLQMEGALQHIQADREASTILPLYLAKFPTVRSFFDDPVADFSRFCKLFQSELYAFTPTLVFHLSNCDAFASRRDITRIFTTLPRG